jgi:23S rRNA (cytidine1920-2'-O)/16S rRNA (cytidine1409-2'-O)-methyltransferase
MNSTRLDILLTERDLSISRERAKAIIMSGDVFVEGRRADKPGVQVSRDAAIEIRQKMEYVSRGGKKLEKALEHFNVSPEGKTCIDCGASTGGFTDCLLQNGARMVYAVDVGYGQLAWAIRNDPRVVTMERTNIRDRKSVV